MAALPSDLKHLYLGWIDEDAAQCQKRQQKSAMLLSNAARTLRNHLEPVYAPEELKKLKGIGDWVVGKMRRRLESYCKENGYVVPVVVVEPVKTAGQKRRKGDGGDDGTTKRKQQKYVPRKRSGGYAILLVLLEYDADMMGLTKNLIIQYGAPYCDGSLESNPGTSQFYSAWNSSKKLLQEGLIKSSGRPQRFFLTDEGLELAQSIKANDGVVFRNETRTQLQAVPRVTNDPVRRSPTTPRVHTPQRASRVARLPEISPTVPVFIPRDRIEHVYRGINYFFWEPKEYEVKFIIDNREVKSKDDRDFFDEKLTQLGVECLKRPLPVGDGLWIARHRTTNEEVVLDYIMERKRLDDLAMSIKDGRYTEQKSRLKRTGIENIFYLIEEVTGSDIQQMSQAIETAMSSATTVNGFHVQRTKGAHSTLRFIKLMTEEIVKFYTTKRLLILNPHTVESQLKYSEILESFKARFPTDTCVHLYNTFDVILNKSSMLTVRELFVRMLMTVRGITLEKAIAIQRQFPTPAIMFERFDPQDQEFVSKYGKKVAESLGDLFKRSN